MASSKIRRVYHLRYRGQPVTTLVDGEGTPWWAMREICSILRYINNSSAVRNHCKHPKVVKANEARRAGLIVGNRGVLVIPKSDLYSLIDKSILPDVEDFECWIREVAIPAVKNTGAAPAAGKVETESAANEAPNEAAPAEPDKAAPQEPDKAVAPGQNQIIPFAFQGLRVTTIVDGDGNPWWVAKEVCDILGYANSRDTLKKHCKHTKLLRGSDSLRLGLNPRGVNIIPESNLYRLIIKSQLPAAEPFERWVMEEVLPTIRKTGGYQMPTSDKDRAVYMAQQLLLEVEQNKKLTRLNQRLAAEKEALSFEKEGLAAEKEGLAKENDALHQEKSLLEKLIEKNAPMVKAADEFINSQGVYAMRTAAKIMGLPPNRLTLTLRKYRILMHNNLPYQRYMDQGLFDVELINAQE